MPTQTTGIKLFFILCTIIIFGLSTPNAAFYFLILSISVTILFFIQLITRVFLKSSYFLSRIIPNPGTLLILAILFLLFFIRLSFEKKPAKPPELWYSLSGSVTPRYERRIRADVRILKSIRPGLYLASVQIKKVEKRVCLKNRTARKRPPWYRKYRRKYFKGIYKNRKYRKRYRKYRYYKKKKYRGCRYREAAHWVAVKSVERVKPVQIAEQNQGEFPVFININEKNLRSGCTLKLFVFGRGVPRKLRESSYDKYLIRNGAYSYIRLSKKYHVESIHCDPPGLRAKLHFRIQNILVNGLGLNDKAVGVAKGLLLGKSYYLNRSFKKKGIELGILHLFAASGLHLAVFYGVLYLPFAMLWGKKRFLSLAAPLPLCFFYLWFLDFPVSFSRAFIFVCFFALKSIVHRPLSTAEYLTNAALVLAFLMPRNFCTLSGALSFGAVSGILFFYKPFFEQIFCAKNRISKIIFSQLALTLSASLLIIPVLILTFQAHSFSGPIANCLLTPFIALFLPVLYITMMLEAIPIFEFLAIPMRIVAKYGIEFFINATEFFSSYSLYYKFDSILCLPFVVAIILTALMIFLMLSKNRPQFRNLQKKIRLVIFILIALLGPVGFFILQFENIPGYLQNILSIVSSAILPLLTFVRFAV